MFLVGLSATTTTMRLPIAPIREDRQTRGFPLDVMLEVVALAQALGVPLPADHADQRLAFTDALRRHDLVDAPRSRAREPSRNAGGCRALSPISDVRSASRPR